MNPFEKIGEFFYKAGERVSSISLPITKPLLFLYLWLKKQFIFVFATVVIILGVATVLGGFTPASAQVEPSNISLAQQAQASKLSLSTATLSGVNRTVQPTADDNTTLSTSIIVPNSPKDWATQVPFLDSLPDACNYLTFCRWFGLSSLPLPDVGITSMSQIPALFSAQIGQFLFLIANVAVFLLGFALLLSSWIDIADKFTYIADFIFATMSSKFLVGSGAVFYIVIFALAVVATTVVFYGMRSNRVMTNRIISKTIMGALVLFGIAFMGHQAQSNHLSTLGSSGKGTPIAYKMGLTRDPSKGTSSDLDVVSPALDIASSNKSMDMWAPFSPGWIIASIDAMTNALSGILVNVADNIGSIADASTGSVDGGGTQNIDTGSTLFGDSSCDAYISALHQIFSDTKVAEHIKGRVGILTQYDRISTAMYTDNWRSAALGGSVSARNAWCRSAETQKSIPAGQQIMVSRVAGLYGDAIGVGGLGLVGGNPAYTINSKGLTVSATNVGNGYVTADGSWSESSVPGDEDFRKNKDGENIFTGASNFLKDVADKALNATHTNSPATDFLLKDKSVIDVTSLSKKALSAQIANDVFGPSYTDFLVTSNKDSKGGLGTTKAAYVWAICNWNTNTPNGSVFVNPEWSEARSAEGKSVSAAQKVEDCKSAVNAVGSPDMTKSFGFSTETGKSFDYHDADPAFWGLFGPSRSIGPKYLSDAPRALDYYYHIQGSSAGAAIFVSIIPMVLVHFMIKYFGAVIFGGFVAEFIASMIITLMFLLLFLLVIPIKRFINIAKSVGLTALATLMTSAFVAFLLACIFATVNIFRAMMRASIPTDLDFINALLNGFAIILAFVTWHTILMKVAKGNLTGAMGGSFLTRSALSPIMRGLGQNAPSPWQQQYWTGMAGKDTRSEEGTVVGDSTGEGSKTSKVDQSVFAKKGKGKDDPTSTEKKNPLQRAAGLFSGIGLAQLGGSAIAALNGIKPSDYRRDENGSWINKKTGVPVTDINEMDVLDRWDKTNGSGATAVKDIEKADQKSGENVAGLISPVDTTGPSVGNEIVLRNPIGGTTQGEIEGITPLVDASGNANGPGTGSSDSIIPRTLVATGNQFKELEGKAVGGVDQASFNTSTERADSALFNGATRDMLFSGAELAKISHLMNIDDNTLKTNHMLEGIKGFIGINSGLDPSEISNTSAREFAEAAMGYTGDKVRLDPSSEAQELTKSAHVMKGEELQGIDIDNNTLRTNRILEGIKESIGTRPGLNPLVGHTQNHEGEIDSFARNMNDDMRNQLMSNIRSWAHSGIGALSESQIEDMQTSQSRAYESILGSGNRRDYIPQGTWDSWSDLRDWHQTANIDDMSSWPIERQQEMSRVAEEMRSTFEGPESPYLIGNAQESPVMKALKALLKKRKEKKDSGI